MEMPIYFFIYNLLIASKVEFLRILWCNQLRDFSLHKCIFQFPMIRVATSPSHECFLELHCGSYVDHGFFCGVSSFFHHGKCCFYLSDDLIVFFLRCKYGFPSS